MKYSHIIYIYFVCQLIQSCAPWPANNLAEQGHAKEQAVEEFAAEDVLEPSPQDQIKLEQSAVLELLGSYRHLSKIYNLVVDTIPAPLSKDQCERLTDLCHSLPPELKKDIDFAMDDGPKWRVFAKKWTKIMGLKRAHDLGGHGGTYLAGVSLKNQQAHQVFLKPKDPIEERNYRLIHDLALELAAFMPTIYGTVELTRSSFIVMQNISFGPDGESLVPLADIKLAGQLTGKGHFNPIADQEEMLVTRNQEKGWFDYQQMALGAKSSPNYMIVQSKLRIGRIFRYKDSETYLLKILAKSAPAELKELDRQLEDLANALERSPVAFIGASLILVKSASGHLKAVLVDPAHMQVDPAVRARPKPSLESFELEYIYYGNDLNYANRKESNRRALEAIRATIATASASLEK